MQLDHMKSFFAYMKPDYETAIEGVTYIADSWILRMFDSDLNTSWRSHISSRVNGEQWEVKFQTDKPITPKKYTIYTDADWNSYNESNPTLWALYGKDDEGNWHQMDQRVADPGMPDALPEGNNASKTYIIQHPGTYKEFQLVIVNYAGSLSGFYGFFHRYDTMVRIAELKFEE